MLVVLTVLAAFSAFASDLPLAAAWPLSVVAVGHGLRLVLRESRQRPRSVVISDDGAAVNIDGLKVEGFTVQWRGPLAFARWRDRQGLVHRLAWWPDTLPRSARRELRLAAPAASNASNAHSMAT